MPAENAKTIKRLEVTNAEFIFGSTDGMREIREKIERALRDDLPVLIEGESGTGKDTIAQYLHRKSVRKDGPFMKFNCAALPEGRLEAELFGYEKGSDADVREIRSDSTGASSGGTLFLDEIGKLDVALQQRLARIFVSGRYRRINCEEDMPVNARFVGATNIDLEAAMRSQTFVDELLGCFANHRLRLIPLRDRREDIPELCDYLLGKFARSFGRPVPKLSSYALEAFRQWKWPGNVRELENWIARIVIFGAEDVMGLEFRRQLGAADGSSSHRGSNMRVGRARGSRRHS